MKTKFHLAKRNVGRHPYPTTHQQNPTAAQTVALVDERYLGWLSTQQSGAQSAILRGALVPVMGELAQQASPDAHFLRVYLFTDKPSLELHDDLVARTVPLHSADGGLGLVRALGLELTQLAQRGQCNTVLLASDDERLIPYIDEAQWRGLRVMVLADEASLDVGRLSAEDPSWARLLAQADRRLAIPAEAWQALWVAGNQWQSARAVYQPTEVPRTSHYANMAVPTESESSSESYFSTTPPAQDWLDQVRQVVTGWWAEESHDAKLDLHDEMRDSQGVPPETDRHLLLRVRREMGRTLSFQEKKAMREIIRATVFEGQPGATSPLNLDLSHASSDDHANA
ncbi:MAG: hypothetical protein RI959_778 [Pseudomonadota bacterium]